MASSSWTAWFRIRDQGAQATLGSMTDAVGKLSDAFGSKLMKSFNSFNLMKAGIEAVVKGAQELVNESKEIVTMSTRFDIPIAKIGGLRNAAKSFGMDANGLAGSLQGLEKSINNAITRPGVDASRTFAKLGFSQQEVIAWNGKTDVAFAAVNARLRNFKDEGERAAAVQEIYGGNSEAVIELMKRTPEAFDAASDAAYTYSDSLTKNNSETLDALNDINEDMKPIYQFVAAIAGFVIQILATIVQGVKVVAKLIIDVVMGMIEVIEGAIEQAFYSVQGGLKKLWVSGKSMIGAISDEEEARQKQEIDVVTSARGKSSKKRMSHGWDRVTKGVDTKDMNDMNNRLTKLGGSYIAVQESLGKQSATEEMQTQLESYDEQISKLKELASNRRKDMEQKRKDGKDTTEDYENLIDLEDDLIEKQMNRGKIAEALAKLQLAKPQQGSVSQTSNELEDVIEMDRLKKQELEYERQRIAAGSQPKIFKDALELRIASEKRLQAEKELAKLQLAGLDPSAQADKLEELSAQGINMTQDDLKNISSKRDIKRIKEMENKVLEAKNKEASVAQGMTDDALAQSKQIKDAERDRTLAAIEGVRERERYADKIKGVSAIDQQTSELNFQIDNLKREQEKLDAMNANPQTTAAERQKQQDVVQKQTFGAAGAMDKLMAMQYNFVASNAAKAGMGGGVSETNNLIDINKEQLNYLKKMYEALLASSGQSGKSFQYYPLQLQGRNIKD